MSITAIYPVPLDEAFEIALRADLPAGTTCIEPSRYAGYAFSLSRDALFFMLRFDAAKLWPTDDMDTFLMVAPDEMSADRWLAQQAMPFVKFEITALQFGTEDDQRAFEAGLC